MDNITTKKHNMPSKTFIIAELSANHNGSKQTALDSIRAAKQAGADAIKIQTYTADTLTLNCDKPEFLAGDLWKGEELYDLYKKAYTPWEWHEEIFQVAKEEGLICWRVLVILSIKLPRLKSPIFLL